MPTHAENRQTSCLFFALLLLKLRGCRSPSLWWWNLLIFLFQHLKPISVFILAWAFISKQKILPLWSQVWLLLLLFIPHKIDWAVWCPTVWSTSAWQLWLHLAMLRILFFFKWSQISTCFCAVVAVRVQIQQVEGWGLVSAYHGYCAVLITSKSLASPSFSVTFYYLYHPPIIILNLSPFPASLTVLGLSERVLHLHPPAALYPSLLFDLLAFVIAFLLSCEI